MSNTWLKSIAGSLNRLIQRFQAWTKRNAEAHKKASTLPCCSAPPPGAGSKHHHRSG